MTTYRDIALNSGQVVATITSDGYIGLGTSVPVYMLDVRGDGYCNSLVSNKASIRESSAPSGVALSSVVYADSTSHTLRFSSNNDGYFLDIAPLRAYCSADEAYSTNVLRTSTFLQVTVQAGKTYAIQAELFADTGPGGSAWSLVGGCTASNIMVNGVLNAAGTFSSTRLVALAGTGNGSATASLNWTLSGSIEVNAGGFLAIQFSQASSNGTATNLKRGSYLLVKQIG